MSGGVLEEISKKERVKKDKFLSLSFFYFLFLFLQCLN